MGFRVENWRMPNKKSFSDHNWIFFSLNFAIEVSYPFRELRKKFNHNKIKGVKLRSSTKGTESLVQQKDIAGVVE